MIVDVRVGQVVQITPLAMSDLATPLLPVPAASASSSSSSSSSSSIKSRTTARGMAVRHRHHERAARLTKVTNNFRDSAMLALCQLLLKPVLRLRKNKTRIIQPAVAKDARGALAVVADRLVRNMIRRATYITRHQGRSTVQRKDLAYITQRDFGRKTYGNHDTD